MSGEIEGALMWCIEQAESIMQISAGAASVPGTKTGALQMINSMASDIAINLRMAAQAIEASRGPRCGDPGADLCAACSVPIHDLTQVPGCGGPLPHTTEHRPDRKE